MRILTICGSLRSVSSNQNLLRAAELVIRDRADVVHYTRLGDLPHFNPDVEERDLPAEPARLRAELGAADALLISSPEYAHGVPGSMKNALDWLVGGPEMVGKAVAVLNASNRSTIAHAQLLETLRTMSANVVIDASVTIALDARKGMKPEEMAADGEIRPALRSALERLLAAAAITA